MRVSIDFDTVVSTDPMFYSDLINLMNKRGLSVVLTCSHQHVNDADDWAYRAGVREVFVLREGKQHQDILSADIWMTGRPDRVVGKEQVSMIHQKMRARERPDEYL